MPPKAAAAAAPPVPRVLLVRLYRQVLHSSDQYAHHASLRGLTAGRELQRLLAVPQRSTNAWNAAAQVPAPAAAAISTQLDQWIARQPGLFRSLDERSSSINADAEKSAPTTAATQTPSSAVAASSSTDPPPSASPPVTAAGLSSSVSAPRALPVPATPRWVVAAYEAGFHERRVEKAWMRRLLGQAFRLPTTEKTRSGSGAKSVAPSISVRMSNAFALQKRLSERAAELALLPLTPLASSAHALLPGVVRVSLTSLGLFKAVKGSFWFQVEWRVENISREKTLALTARTLKTQDRGSAAMAAAAAAALGSSSGTQTITHGQSGGGGAGGMNSAMLAVPMPPVEMMRRSEAAMPYVASGAPSTIASASIHHRHASGSTASAIGGPASSPATAATNPTTAGITSSPSLHSLGLHVSSSGSGLSGQPVGLPPGSAVERKLATIRLDASVGVLGAELTFLDYSAHPPKEFTLQIDPILLDAYAPPPPPILPPVDVARETGRLSGPRSRHEHRDMLTGALRMETARLDTTPKGGAATTGTPSSPSTPPSSSSGPSPGDSPSKSA